MKCSRTVAASVVFSLAAFCKAMNAGAAETNLQSLVRLCPNGPQIAEATRRMDKATASARFNDLDIAAQQASREEYRCYKAVSDRHVTEFAHYFYGRDMLVHLMSSPAKLRSEGPNLAREMDALARTSQSSGLRKDAADLRDHIRSRVAEVNVH